MRCMYCGGGPDGEHLDICPMAQTRAPYPPQPNPLPASVRLAVSRCAEQRADSQLTMRAHEWAALNEFLKDHP